MVNHPNRNQGRGLKIEDDADIWEIVPMLDIHQFQAVKLLDEARSTLTRLTDWQKENFPKEAALLKKIKKYFRELEKSNE